MAIVNNEVWTILSTLLNRHSASKGDAESSWSRWNRLYFGNRFAIPVHGVLSRWRPKNSHAVHKGYSLTTACRPTVRPKKAQQPTYRPVHTIGSILDPPKTLWPRAWQHNQPSITHSHEIKGPLNFSLEVTSSTLRRVRSECDSEHDRNAARILRSVSLHPHLERAKTFEQTVLKN